MSVEARRGCGYRKVGGLYLVGPKLEAGCGRLPLVHVCPVCQSGIKQTRGWVWKGVSPVTVPDSDKDHRGSVFDTPEVADSQMDIEEALS